MKVLCKCGKYACTDSAASTRATCGYCGRQWLWVNGPHENDWTLVHELPIIAYLKAQRDLMTALLRKHAAVKCPGCDGMGIDMSEDEDRLCGTCAGSGSAYPDDVAAALAKLTPTAPTNGEGDAK